MSDPITKFLRRLSIKDRDRVELLIRRIILADLEGLDIKRLVGLNGIFRVRQGRVRIIYEQRHGIVRIIRIAFRDDTTYKDMPR